MPIALLKFPNDLLREVFGLCDPFELYKLSKCSKKCSQKAIMLRGTKKWKISYGGGNAMTISADGSRYNFRKTQKPRDYFKIEHIGRNGNCMYIEFQNGGPVELFVYLLELFGIRTVKVLEPSYGSIVNVSKVAQVLVDRKMEIEKFWTGYYKGVQDVINFMPLIHQMKISQEFECSIKFPPEFHFEFVHYPSEIFLTHSFWFDINQLSNSTCTRVNLHGSMLSNRDLDVFLQKWKETGAFPNLRYLEIRSQKIDQSPILEMIPPIQTVNNPRIEVSICNVYHDNIIDGVQVNKDDGTEGWLKVDVGDSPKLTLLIANPADTVVEEMPENDEDDW